MRDNPYESLRYVTEYLLFHYGQPNDQCPWRWVPREMLRFHARLRTECLRPIGRSPGTSGETKGLDLGCGVGRFTFELGRIVDHCLGIDNSSPFVRAARNMAKKRQVTIEAREFGRKFTTLHLRLPAGLRRSKVQFQVGDAMALAARGRDMFHVVAAVNLLCRLPHPRRFLGHLHRLVLPGGQLLLASPFTWMEQYSPRGKWLSPTEVLEILERHFHLVRHKSLPFVIREHRRKYQLIVSEAMLFLRK